MANRTEIVNLVFHHGWAGQGRCALGDAVACVGWEGGEGCAGRLWRDEVAAAGDDDVMTGWAGARGALDGDSSSSRSLQALGTTSEVAGWAGAATGLFSSAAVSFLSTSRTVEFDEDEVRIP